MRCGCSETRRWISRYRESWSSPGLDVVLLGVPVFYRFRFSPARWNHLSFSRLNFNLFPPSFLHSILFLCTTSLRHDLEFRISDRRTRRYSASIDLGRCKPIVLSSSFRTTYSFLFFLLFLPLCLYIEHFTFYAERAALDKMQNPAWLILSFDACLRSRR